MNDQLIENWLGDRVKINMPATDEEINECEEKIEFKFPEDFKAFYKKMNGFKDWDMDSEMLSLWPLEKIMEEYDNSEFIGFCDFLIHSHLIGLSKTQSGIYKNYNTDDMTLICNTFEEFLEHWQSKTQEYL
jgi:hypothetical protein